MVVTSRSLAAINSGSVLPDGRSAGFGSVSPTRSATLRTDSWISAAPAAAVSSATVLIARFAV